MGTRLKCLDGGRFHKQGAALKCQSDVNPMQIGSTIRQSFIKFLHQICSHIGANFILIAANRGRIHTDVSRTIEGARTMRRQLLSPQHECPRVNLSQPRTIQHNINAANPILWQSGFDTPTPILNGTSTPITPQFTQCYSSKLDPSQLALDWHRPHQSETNQRTVAHVTRELVYYGDQRLVPTEDDFTKPSLQSIPCHSTNLLPIRKSIDTLSIVQYSEL